MRTLKLFTLTSICAVIFSACGGGTSIKNPSDKGFDVNNYPKTEKLSPELKNALAYMGNEERLAYDVYMNLYSYHKKENNDEIKQFYNIATNSETKHIKTVRDIVNRYNISKDELNINHTVVESNNMSKDLSQDSLPSGVYDIDKIQKLYDDLYTLGVKDKESALKVGCLVEVTDINDLNEYIKLAQEAKAEDIKSAFEFLRKGSYNHYWAFDKGLKNMGIEHGCNYGEGILTNKEGIYPKNEKGGGNGKGKGKN